MTVQTQSTIQDLNKQIARTIIFRDRMRDLNRGLKAGQTEKDLGMTVFEMEIRLREGNHRIVKTKDGKSLKLFSRPLLERSANKVRRLCDEKNELVQLSQMGLA